MNPYIDEVFLHGLRRIARLVCKQFDLEPKSIKLFEYDDPEAKRSWGLCYPDGSIKISLRGRRKRICKIETMVDTLLHELAHLKHRNHSKAFHKYYRRLVYWTHKNLF